MNKKLRIGIASLLIASTFCGCQGNSAVSSDKTPVKQSETEATVSAVSESTEQTQDTTASQSEKPEETKPEETKPEDTTNASEQSKPAGTLVGNEGFEINGKLILDLDIPTLGRHSWGLWLFSGWDGEEYASYINEFKKKVGDEVNVFNMIIPTASEYYTPEQYKDYNASQRDTINDIANRLEGVINIDACSELAQHTDEYIYFRTDHHWQAIGAYYAAKLFTDTALAPIKDIKNYEKRELGDFVGALYSLSDNPEQLRRDPDKFTYYVSPTEYRADYYTGKFEIDKQVENIKTIYIEPSVQSDDYCIYMGGDMRIVKITSENKNGRKLVLFKDSFGSALAPFLMDGFEEVYICDVRYFNTDAYKFIKNNDITDVLFNFCTFSTKGQICDSLKENVLGHKGQ